ncbi:MAG: hypothetical protein ABH817_01160 [archaeon]
MKKEMIIMLVICLLFLVSGQAGCEIGGGGGAANKYGLDFTLVSGLEYLSTGKVLQQGDSFYVVVQIENFDLVERSGQVCILDDIHDAFGGISSQGSGECKGFVVKSAEIANKIIPSVTKVYFPESSEYSYYNLPKSLNRPYSGKLYVSLKYTEQTKADGTVNVPGSGGIMLSQDPAPITINAQSSINKKGDLYKLTLQFDFVKIQQAKFFSPDFSEENITYLNIALPPQNLECVIPPSTPISNRIEFQKQKTIKCYTDIYSTQPQAFPLIIQLDYGVEITKIYPFSLSTEGY